MICLTSNQRRIGDKYKTTNSFEGKKLNNYYNYYAKHVNTE